MINLDKELVGRIRSLELVYTDKPQPQLLIQIPDVKLVNDCEVQITTQEFTSLCPFNVSQPDYAKITIRYKPDGCTVELKSLKFYLASFRQVPVFHELIPDMILTALTALVQPEYASVEGNFTTRGGLDTSVSAFYSILPKVGEDK